MVGLGLLGLHAEAPLHSILYRPNQSLSLNLSLALKQAKQTADLHIGICGAGIGGLAAAIAVAKAGARVTILEAAHELGEIGAGIQMTPNAARLLIRWGVDRVVGDNLVECEELNLRRRDGTKVGYTKMVPEARRFVPSSIEEHYSCACLLIR